MNRYEVQVWVSVDAASEHEAYDIIKRQLAKHTHPSISSGVLYIDAEVVSADALPDDEPEPTA